MTAAKMRRESSSEQQLLVLSENSKTQKVRHLKFADLPELLVAGDVLVFNDAATLPASFYGIHSPTGKTLEMRLASSLSADEKLPSRWRAIFFGEGDWRTPTESRLLPPSLRSGDLIEFGPGLVARIEFAANPARGFVEIEFVAEKSRLWEFLYRYGRPIQYSHLAKSLSLWDVQTLFASSPVALEAPSAAFPFRWELVSDLKSKGIDIVRLTHAAGISSAGDSEIDRQLPLPEKFRIPSATAEVVNRAVSERRRVIAIGTSATRALESAADENGIVREGSGVAELIITPAYRHKVVNGIMSGFHESGASHLKLLGSFVSPESLASAYLEAERYGYVSHEYGDSCLILP